jgi:hypothetical protein
LVKELRLAGSSMVEATNAWLSGFVEDYNKRFGRAPANAKDLHRRDKRLISDVLARRARLRLPKPAKRATLSRNRRESGEYRLTTLISGTPRADL